jgi:hypothetical protein
MIYNKPIINQIEEISKFIPGWSSIDQLYSLFLLLYSMSYIKGNVIEIGSWCGKSSSILGLASYLTNVEQVLCIDLFPNKTDWFQNIDGTYSFKTKCNDKQYIACKKHSVWEKTFNDEFLSVYGEEEDLLNIFRKNMMRLEYNNIITPYKGDSSIIKDVVNKNFKCKFAFIDGDHDYEAVCKDIQNIEPYLVLGSWICFDDAFSTYTDVDCALYNMIIENKSYTNCQQLTRKLFVAQKCG